MDWHFCLRSKSCYFSSIYLLYLCDLLYSLVLFLSMAFELGSKCSIYFSSSYCYEKSLIPKFPTLQQHLLHCTKKGRLVFTNTSMTVVAGTVQSLSYIHIRAPYIKLSLCHILQLTWVNFLLPGLSVGIELSYIISYCLSYDQHFNLGTAYLLLQLRERIYGYRHQCNSWDQYWAVFVLSLFVQHLILS